MARRLGVFKAFRNAEAKQTKTIPKIDKVTTNDEPVPPNGLNSSQKLQYMVPWMGPRLGVLKGPQNAESKRSTKVSKKAT